MCVEVSVLRQCRFLETQRIHNNNLMNLEFEVLLGVGNDRMLFSVCRCSAYLPSLGEPKDFQTSAGFKGNSSVCSRTQLHRVYSITLTA